jgi:ASC-1-like (ASCH) protein
MRTKTLWIREQYLAQILAGSKTIEVRVAYPNIAQQRNHAALQPGNRLLLNERPYSIRRIARYGSFRERLACEARQAIAPDLTPEELLSALQALYPPDVEALGVVALEIEPEAS